MFVAEVNLVDIVVVLLYVFVTAYLGTWGTAAPRRHPTTCGGAARRIRSSCR